MSVISDLEKKLRSAKRAEASAVRESNKARDEYTVCEAEHRKRQAAVAELESALSILRNNLKPVISQTGNVTKLR